MQKGIQCTLEEKLLLTKDLDQNLSGSKPQILKIRTLKNQVYKYITSKSKKVYIDKLGDMVEKI